MNLFEKIRIREQQYACLFLIKLIVSIESKIGIEQDIYYNQIN
jgi:hypothetical protein